MLSKWRIVAEIVFQDIFLDDGLHMNKKGYDIWATVIRPLIDR